jgi:hypothetical protein
MIDYWLNSPKKISFTPIPYKLLSIFPYIKYKLNYIIDKMARHL